MIQMLKLFQQIYTKEYNPSKFESLQVDATESLALLAMEFPPSFFDVMTHLPYHIIEELDMCGSLSTRWMYPVHGYMKPLKNYVCNMARPEASMAEGYVQEECLGFVTEYLQRFDVVEWRVWNANEEYGNAEEVLEGGAKPYIMTTPLCDATHKYALRNMFVM